MLGLGSTLVFYEESLGGNVAVLRNTASADAFHCLYIQGVSNSDDSITSFSNIPIIYPWKP